jgi:TldD protein
MITLILMAALAAKPPVDPRQDVLDAMVVELDRNRVQLKLNESKPPYFISYQLKDFDQVEINARYGALFLDQGWRERKLFADVRVGDYAYDSSITDTDDFSFSMKGNSYITGKNAPWDDSSLALRTALWLITDEKYKGALFNYLKKKGDDVYTVDDPKRASSFSKEAPVVHLGGKVGFEFSRDRWRKLARDLSGTVASHKEIFDSEVRVTADKVTRYFVSTEGTRVVTEETMYGFHVSAFTRANDGQLLENSRDYYAPTEAMLPDDEKIRTSTDVMVSELLELRAAPAIDPYTGPAILEPDAAGVLFHEAVGHRLEGERQDGDAEGKTFRGQVGKQVLPSFLSIYDDPTLRERNGVQLNGFYLFDEEGVRGQRVALVENGVLKSYLLSRRPVDGFAQSNGHGRSQGNRKPVARMANLIVESKKPVSDGELKKMLIAEAKRQGKPFGLIIRDITGGNTNTSTFGYQAFKGVPRMVYRVDVRDGKESLVRGVEVVGTPLSSINRVMATGPTQGVFNGYCGAESGMVPVSTVAPATLLQEIELQRALEGKDRPPLIPGPSK